MHSHNEYIDDVTLFLSLSKYQILRSMPQTNCNLLPCAHAACVQITILSQTQMLSTSQISNNCLAIPIFKGNSLNPQVFFKTLLLSDLVNYSNKRKHTDWYKRQTLKSKIIATATSNTIVKELKKQKNSTNSTQTSKELSHRKSITAYAFPEMGRQYTINAMQHSYVFSLHLS